MIVDHFLDAKFTEEGVLRTTGCRNDMCSSGDRDLHREVPHATARTVNQHALAGADVS